MQLLLIKQALQVLLVQAQMTTLRKKNVTKKRTRIASQNIMKLNVQNVRMRMTKMKMKIHQKKRKRRRRRRKR